jgi:hypothetical protein
MFTLFTLSTLSTLSTLFTLFTLFTPTQSAAHELPRQQEAVESVDADVEEESKVNVEVGGWWTRPIKRGWARWEADTPGFLLMVLDFSNSNPSGYWVSSNLGEI